MAKERYFNIQGLCVPALHYMVDTSEKIDKIIANYVDTGEYFAIHRARQYGKTTTLESLYQRLKERYLIIDLTFEGKEDYFASLLSLANGLSVDIRDNLVAQNRKELASVFTAGIDDRLPLRDIGKRFQRLCELSDEKIILTIDEVDKASDNQVFLSFLGLLRDQYLLRVKRGTPAFYSIILAGVHDIKNLKMKLRPEDQHSYNSPWNIAANFDVDMNFSTPEIATMLNEYEQDHLTGMDIAAMSARLYYYTGGYPFLVSLLCKTIHDKHLGWSEKGVDSAEMLVVKESNTLFDDVTKNLVNNAPFSNLVRRILLEGAHIAFEEQNPLIQMGVMYGILAKDEDSQTIVSNVIFETRIYNFFVSIAQTSRFLDSVAGYRSSFVVDGRLDLAKVLCRFAAFMKSEYRDEDGDFIEREGRLLFLSFLKPIINGTGHYVVEPETRGSRRMDIVVFYGGEEHIVELKIWRGEKAASAAYDQLVFYLRAREKRAGYLLSFCDMRKSPRENKTFTHDGCQLTEVIVAYRDKE